ncbi:VOC family protein [Yinghuangia sp. YIM S09857]|uniref:VOC family protein n=1 Tax=Yinghuangia sp. YIM S09857 TaxID=3436929 RepID=UPI003F52E251
MLTTQYTPGSPIWVDLATPDLDASAAFYSEVLGWEFESQAEAAGNYGVFRLDGRIAAAAGPCREDGGAAAWTLYFHTADADALAKAVERAGGAVRYPPSDVFGAGRTAHFADRAGARFAAWQPGDVKGLEVVDDAGSLAWTELLTADTVGATEFYGAVFAWQFGLAPVPGIDYTVITPAAQEGGGRETGGIVALPPGVPGSDAAPQWYPYFEVGDCDTAVERAVGNGASVIVAADDLPGVGRMTMLADSFGARFNVIKSAVVEGA